MRKSKTAVRSKGEKLPVEQTQHLNYVHVVEGQSRKDRQNIPLKLGGAIAFLVA